jgi:hypothetical protein
MTAIQQDTIAARTCKDGGYIVGPRHRLPADERYFQTPGAQFYVGCNRLRCNLCGGSVRQQVGFTDGPGAPEHARAIYEEQDWGKSPYLLADADSRLYACGCTVVVVSKSQAAVMPNRAWTCAGHPPVESAPGSGPGGAKVLPPMTAEVAMELALFLANSQLTESVNQMAFTLTDGTGLRAFPALIRLQAGMPELKIYTAEDTMTPRDLDFSTVAGACVQLKDGTLKTF